MKTGVRRSLSGLRELGLWKTTSFLHYFYCFWERERSYCPIYHHAKAQMPPAQEELSAVQNKLKPQTI